MPRKRSDATKARCLASQLKSYKGYVQSLSSELKERRRVGGMLSNIAFNLGQRGSDRGVEPELKALLDECRKAWDEIRNVAL